MPIISLAWSLHIPSEWLSKLNFQETMTIPDNLIIKYFELSTDIHPDEVDKIKLELKNPKINPHNSFIIQIGKGKFIKVKIEN